MPERQLNIPNPLRGVQMVGILHECEAPRDRKIALIIHGVLAHKNQSYHKLLANRLESERGMDSYRYDLTGQGGETEGPWDMAAFDDDADDLAVVVDYLTSELKYTVEIIIAHSRGSMMTTCYLATRKHPHIPYFVNVSGRYDMSRILQNKSYVQAFEKEKLPKVAWKCKIAGKDIVRWVTPAQWYAFANWDNSYLHSTFPQDIDVLNVHGLADQLVPYVDAESFQKIFSQRSPGTSELRLIPDMGHNWAKPGHEPVNSIMTWYNAISPLGDAPRTSPARL